MRLAYAISFCAGGASLLLGLTQHSLVDAVYVGGAVFLLALGVCLFLRVFAEWVSE